MSRMTRRLWGRELKEKDRITAGEKYQELEVRIRDLVDFPDSFYKEGVIETCCDYVERYIAGVLTEEQEKYFSKDILEDLVKEYIEEFAM